MEQKNTPINSSKTAPKTADAPADASEKLQASQPMGSGRVIFWNFTITLSIFAVAIIYWPTLETHIISHMPWYKETSNRLPAHSAAPAEIKALEQKIRSAEMAITALAKKLTETQNNLKKIEARKLSGPAPQHNPAPVVKESSLSKQAFEDLKNNLQGELDNFIEEASASYRLITSLELLKRQVLSHEPFAEALEQFSSQLEEGNFRPIPTPLKDIADYGYPAWDYLQEEFEHLAALPAEGPEDKSETMAEALLENLEGYISIRKLDKEGRDGHSLVYLARQAMENQQISRAINRIESLPEAQKAPWDRWLAHARAYEMAPDALLMLESRFYEQLRERRQAR
jgi:hypothetical protein